MCHKGKDKDIKDVVGGKQAEKVTLKRVKFNLRSMDVRV